MKIKYLSRYLILLVLAFSLVILIPQASIAEVAEDSTESAFNFAEFSNLLFVLWFVSWLVESFLEIIQKVFQLDFKKGSEPSPEIAQWTAIGGFIMGVMIFLSGLQILGTLFDFLPGTDPIQVGLFKFVDAVLTASVIAGGSKGIHELTNAYKGIMQVIQNQPIDKPEKSSSPLVPAEPVLAHKEQPQV